MLFGLLVIITLQMAADGGPAVTATPTQIVFDGAIWPTTN